MTREVVRLKRAGLLLLIVGVLSVAATGCFLFPNRPPVAAAHVVYGVDPTDPLVVDLDASASSDPDGDAIVLYQWVFDDDLDLISPAAYTTVQTAPRIRVRCPVEGTYSAQLVVVDERGRGSVPLTGISITVPHAPSGT